MAGEPQQTKVGPAPAPPAVDITEVVRIARMDPATRTVTERDIFARATAEIRKKPERARTADEKFVLADFDQERTAELLAISKKPRAARTADEQRRLATWVSELDVKLARRRTPEETEALARWDAEIEAEEAEERRKATELETARQRAAERERQEFQRLLAGDNLSLEEQRQAILVLARKIFGRLADVEAAARAHAIMVFTGLMLVAILVGATLIATLRPTTVKVTPDKAAAALLAEVQTDLAATRAKVEELERNGGWDCPNEARNPDGSWRLSECVRVLPGTPPPIPVPLAKPKP